MVAAVAAVLVPVFGASVARAESKTVACDGQDDIADVQAAIDDPSLPPASTIRLTGTCDFSAALAHDGDDRSIGAAAVVVRSGTPIAGLVIEGDPEAPATIVGSGSQTAFAVLPGNDGTTIRNLKFASLARPIAVLGASGVTIGASDTPVPAAHGNRIVGDGQLDSAVFAVANGSPMTVLFGAQGAGGSVDVTPASIADLTVLGNQVTFSSPGPAGERDVVAIDVRQAPGGEVDGVTISGNATAMFGADLSSFDHNGVRVEGLEPVQPAPTGPAPADFRIHDVVVEGNNLGRFEELDPARLTGVDPDRSHAAGRVGVLLVRVDDFAVTGNRVRSRLSTAAVGTPGGGIVVSDSAFGRLDGNDVAVAADRSARSRSDLGAIAVVEGIPALFGGSADDQATTGVDVVSNSIGRDVDAPSEPRRGVLLTGVDDVTVWANDVASPSAAALTVGADVGTDAGIGTSARSLPSDVRRSVLCGNTLDGAPDDPDEVAFGASPPSTSNAFPGGPDHGNGECTPTLAVSPEPPTAVANGELLTVRGRAWAGRSVTVTVVDEQDASLDHLTTAFDDGTYEAQVDVSSLFDGAMFVTVLASDAVGLQVPSGSVVAMKNWVADPPPQGTVAIVHGDQNTAYTNALELVGGILVEWTEGDWGTSPPRATIVRVWAVDVNGTTPAACAPTVQPATGSLRLPYECGIGLAEGPYEVKAQWQASDSEFSTIATASAIKDSVLPTVTIDDDAPAEGSEHPQGTVTVSGTAGEPGDVIVRSSEWPPTVFAETAVVDGAWSTDATFEDPGQYSITAFAVDAAGNDGPLAPDRTFTVVPSEGGGGPADTVPPAPPGLLGPDDGSLQPASFVVGGSGDPNEPQETVYVFMDGDFLATTQVNSSDLWAVRVSAPTGSHSLHAVSVDAAGNVSSPSATVTIEVDATPPTLTIETAQDTVFTPTNPVEITGTSSDAHDVQVIVAEYFSAHSSQSVGTDVAGCSPACPAPAVDWTSSPPEPLAPGVHSVTVTAFDALGNSTSKTIRFFKVP